MAWEIKRHGNVALVTMNSNKVNAQDEAFLADLHQAFDRLDGEFKDCAVVITSNKNCFSAGLDFERNFRLFASKNRRQIWEWFESYRKALLRLFTYPRPTVAAINGPAFAGGTILALSCDFRIAVDGPLRLSINEVLIGVPMPAVFCEIIKYAIGAPNASLATLFGAVYDAKDALRLGFVHTLTPAEKLVAEALAAAGAVHPDCFDAYAYSKRGLQAATLSGIERDAASLDSDLPAHVSADGGLRAQRRRYVEIKQREPDW